MIEKKRLHEILSQFKQGKDVLTGNDILGINELAVKYIQGEKVELDCIRMVLEISNIIYNNTSRSILPLEDGIYDAVVARFTKEGHSIPVGAMGVTMDTSDNMEILDSSSGMVNPIVYIPEEYQSKFLFKDSLMRDEVPIREDFFDPNRVEDGQYIEKIKHSVSHSYPELVGTLHKCKFTLVSEATERGLENDDNVMIFERDFLYKYFGIANNIAYQKGKNEVGLLAELKYDGVSIEATVDGDTIINAGSRGDTANDIASDYTPIFGGKIFHRAKGIVPKGTVFGIKFEAIITDYNLYILEKEFGKRYKNARVAIIGILGSSDAYKYRDLITLVPIRTSGLQFEDPIQEINFLNKYYSSGVDMKYAYLEGDYYSLLFQVNRFVQDASMLRPIMGFMYDGVVISFTDPDVIRALGRQNSIDQWSMAIKFDAMSKETIFLGYKYTIGQNGLITPMAYFKPVEFLGSIHNKTTAHSYKRFRELNLKAGDQVKITYVNDVICYIDKINSIQNNRNPNPVIEFPVHCPACGGEVTLSDSGDSAYCLNPLCPERNANRISNMVRKLGMKDFSKAYLKRLNIDGFRALMSLDLTFVQDVLGEVLASKLFERIQHIYDSKIPDYKLVGALGFSSISAERWKMILNNISLQAIIRYSDEDLRNIITMVKGIGLGIGDTIIRERHSFMEDLLFIEKLPNLVITFRGDGPAEQDKKQVRFTGFRSKELEDGFNRLGFDADGSKSVTKKTSILIVPYQGFRSTKMSKISPECLVLTEEQAHEYLRRLK